MTTLLPVIDPQTVGDDCCTPGDPGIAPERAADVAKVFKALSDPARVRLLSIIASAPAGDACICDLTEPVGLAQPTVSHHMKLLAEAGLVTREQRGKWAHFAVAPGARALLDGATNAVLTGGS